jgi:hypothetical protein
MREAGRPVVTAFPDGSQDLRRHPAKAEHPFMLPGFRFLLAAIVLSMSMLIFGLGAAALLRAAHEEFASIPSRRAPPETVFAQQSDARPTLAILRVEPSAADKKAAKPATSDNVQAVAPVVEQPVIASTPAEPEHVAEPDKIAALTDVAAPPENSSPSETLKPEASTTEIPVQAEAQADVPTPVETKVAAIAETTPPVEDSTRIAEMKIATLGGPPVTIETQTPSKLAPAVVKKSAQAKRAIKRRRIAQRARVTQQTPQTPADPFARPLGR